MNTVTESTRDLESEVTVIQLEQDYGSTQFLKLARLESKLHKTLDASPNLLLLDLSDTHFIGAAFLGVLIRCNNRSKSIGSHFALCTLRQFPADVVSITRFGSIWVTFDSRQSALEALALPAMDSPLAGRRLNGE